MINFGSFAQRNASGLWFNNLGYSNRADQWYDKILVQSGFDKSLIWQWICSKGTPLIRNWTKGTHPKINLKSLKTYPLALLSTAGKESVQHLMSQSWSCCHCCGYPQSARLFLIKVTIPSPLFDQTHLKRYTVQFGIFGYSLNLTNVQVIKTVYLKWVEKWLISFYIALFSLQEEDRVQRFLDWRFLTKEIR